jgi:hypothetical protein
MARTQIRGTQLRDSTVQNVDVDTTTSGRALITKVVAGSGISISSTGIDAGTGTVTINAVSSDRSYTHRQLSSSTTWVISHNLGKNPSVVTYDSTMSKRVVIGDVEYVDLNTVKVYFGLPFAGEAYLN